MRANLKRALVAGSLMGTTALLGRPGDARADELLENLSVHGFLSQAYGRADGASVAAIGITKDGTTDYRTAALQFSYAMTDKDRVVFQLSHERIGVAERAAFLPDVAADWLFYEHRFSDDTAIKAGRVPIPLGIYNQIRDVGTLLPFYRPPNALYDEANFVSETVDGVAATHSIALGQWGLELEPYLGGWDTLAITASTGLQRARAHNVAGFGSWLRTPLPGLRVGASFFRSTLRRDLVTPPPDPAPAPENRRLWMVSADGSFSRATVRAEYSQTRDGDSRDRVYSGYVGARVVKGLHAHLEYSKFWVSWFASPLAGSVSGGQRDLAFGFSYKFSSNLVAKIEGHDGEDFAIRVPPPMRRYFLASLAASF